MRTASEPEARRVRPRNDLVLRALAGEATPRTPVWMMRQAGRFDPEYHRLRAEAGLELEDLFRHPEYAAKITMLPVRLGVDAAILYQDILTPLSPLATTRPKPSCSILKKAMVGACFASDLSRMRIEVFTPE